MSLRQPLLQNEQGGRLKEGKLRRFRSFPSADQQFGGHQEYCFTGFAALCVAPAIGVVATAPTMANSARTARR
jgi:hypothetical protein